MSHEDEKEMLNIIKTLIILMHYKNFIIIFSTFAIIASIATALLMTPIYKAETVVSARSIGSKNSNILGQLGGQAAGIASMAGISLGGGNEKISFAKLDSRTMKEKFITDNNLLPILFDEKWDAQSNAWVDKNPEKIPTMWSALKKFKSVMFITKDSVTGLITISVLWKDPILAAEWSNKYVAMVNSVLRNQALQESDEAISFLNNERQKTSVMRIHSAIDALYINELKSAMLANAKKEYYYQTIDPAKAPKEKSKPKRSIIVILGSIIGFLMSLVLVGLYRFYSIFRKYYKLSRE